VIPYFRITRNKIRNSIYIYIKRIIDVEGMHNEIKQTLLYILYIKCVRIRAHIYIIHTMYILCITSLATTIMIIIITNDSNE